MKLILDLREMMGGVDGLPLESREKLKAYLDQTIIHDNRLLLSENHERTLDEHKAGQLKFVNELRDVKKIL